MRYGYRPGGAPEISPAQRARNAAHFAWEKELRTLCEQGTDLAMAGRFQECLEWQELIQAKKAAEPSW